MKMCAIVIFLSKILSWKEKFGILAVRYFAIKWRDKENM